MGKSRAVKPSRDQKELIRNEGLNEKDYLIIKEDAEKMELAHRSNGSTRIIWKKKQKMTKRWK